MRDYVNAASMTSNESRYNSSKQHNDRIYLHIENKKNIKKYSQCLQK